ncbi:MAG: hypothetical protein ACHQD8_05990 [Chitinophagales bacterium]
MASAAAEVLLLREVASYLAMTLVVFGCTLTGCVLWGCTWCYKAVTPNGV